MFPLKKVMASAVCGIALSAGLIVLSSVAPVALAQATSGNVSGIVVDSSGAAIPNAKIHAVNIATNIATDTIANGSGEFTITNLPPGKYNVTGSATGFSSFLLENLEIKQVETASVKLTLPVSSQSTAVEVSAEASVAIDTTTPQLTTTFESKEIADLPIASVGLGVLNLSLLTPGVTSSGAVGAGTGPSVGGQRPRANNYTVEGIDNNNKSVTGPLVYVPNDNIGEFTMITNQFSPEFGHSAGGQFNVTLKSGSNSFHGSAYEYSVNRAYNAENAIAGGKIPNPRYDFNRYGGQVGGPVLRNRIFFFGGYERQTTGQSGQYYLCTPTAAGISTLQGISSLNQTNLGIYTKYMPVAASQIDASADNACFNQLSGGQSLTVYDGTGARSDGTFGSGNEYSIPLGNTLVSAPSFTNFDALTTGFDYTISTQDTLRGRYIYNTEGTPDTAAALPAFYTTLPYRFHLIALSEYHNFTPTLINEVRVGFNRYFNNTPSGNFSFPGLNQFPNLTFYDQGFVNLGPDGNAPQSTIQNLYQFTDNLGWIRGKHTMKFGFDGRKFISPQSFTQRVRGDYQWSLLSEYLHDLAPDANGFGERSTGNFFYYGDQTALYAYANDTWKVTKTLALNYGIRYEFTSVPVGERAQILNAAASVPGLITFGKPSPQYLNFTPRVGIVYAPNEDTSIRAGFGMAMDVLYDNLGILSFPPQYSSTTDVGANVGAGIPDYGTPNFLANGGLPAGTGTLATFSSVADQRAATSAYVPNQKLPYAETWSLGVEHVFHRDYTASIRYVGTRGIHLSTQIRLNKQAKTDATHFLPTYINMTPSDAELASLPNTLKSLSNRSSVLPEYAQAGFTSNMTSFVPGSESSYNGLELNLQRRFTNGLQTNISYTWSKTMDDATADVFSTVLTPRRPQDFQNIPGDYSRSALDHSQRFTLELVYDLPFFKHQSWLVKNLVGNWEVAPIYIYESPEYYTALSGDDANMNGDGAYIDRTVFNPNGKQGTGSAVNSLYDSSRASLCGVDAQGNPITQCSRNLVAYQAVDPTARFIQAGSGAIATSSRNNIPINPINDLDATVIKRFSVAERYKVEFSAQAFNVLNHAQYLPGTLDNINSPGYTSSLNFQTVTSSGFNTPDKFFAANARSMQLALKFSF